MKTNRLLLELMALVTIVPILNANLHIAVCFFIFILWFINSVKRTSVVYVIKDPWGVSKWWLILIAYELLLSIIGFSSTSPTNFVMRIPVYGIPIIMTFVLRQYSIQDQKQLFVFIVGIVVVVILQNSFIYLRNPSAFSDFTLREDVYRWTNWGTSGFVGCSLFIVPSCFLIWQSTTKGNVRTLALLGMILPFFYITFINERATSFILLLYFLIALWYVRKVRINNKLVFTCLTIILFVVGFILVEPMLDWLSSVLGSEKLAVRLDSIATSISNSNIDENSEGSLYARYYLMQVDIRTWTQSFFSILFGIGEDALPAGSMGFISDLESLGIGQHSQIVDFLAMYGIVGTMMLFNAFHSTFSCIRSFCPDKSIIRELNVVFLGYILMSVFNNVLYTHELFVMFVLFALSVKIYFNESNTTYNKSVSYTNC